MRLILSSWWITLVLFLALEKLNITGLTYKMKRFEFGVCEIKTDWGSKFCIFSASI